MDWQAWRAVTKPPPPRYRIIERDGRLITIDTWAKHKAPQQPNVPSPRVAPVAPGGGISAVLVAAILKGRDDQGRRLLTTSPNWDRKGPRVIALSAAGERRVGLLLLASCIVAIAAIVAVIVDLELMLPWIVVAVVLAGAVSNARTPRITRFLDTLGDELPR